MTSSRFQFKLRTLLVGATLAAIVAGEEARMALLRAKCDRLQKAAEHWYWEAIVSGQGLVDEIQGLVDKGLLPESELDRVTGRLDDAQAAPVDAPRSKDNREPHEGT